MKRCPECGFRANDKICPLCGVRMRDLPAAAQVSKTHSHKQDGERCVLPNQERPRRPAVQPDQPKPRTQPYPEKKQKEKSAQPNISTKILPVLVVILVVLLRSCMG